MDFEYASIALLGSMVLVLAGLVGWLYWQQTRMFQSINNLVMVVGELASRPSAEEEPAPVPEPEPEPEPVAVAVAEPEAVEDDRVSVDGEVTLVEGPPATATTPDENDTDGLESKTKKELQDILTKRGIPFSKSDAKGALISLLKATA
jgi:hypothetical protein